MEAHKRLVKQIPCFKDAIFVHAFAGLYDVTRDWHPLLGGRRVLQGSSCVAV